MINKISSGHLIDDAREITENSRANAVRSVDFAVSFITFIQLRPLCGRN